MADSGSTDGSRDRAVAAGARVIDVPRGEFSHGGTRNMLMARGRRRPRGVPDPGRHPGRRQLAGAACWRLRAGRRRGAGLRPLRAARPDASPMVRRELDRMFASFAPDGRPRVDRGAGGDRDARRASSPTPTAAWPGGRGSRCRSGRCPTPRTRCWRATCWRRAGRRPTSPRPPCCTPTTTPPGELLRRAFDEAARCARSRATARTAGPVTVLKVVQRHVRDDLALRRRAAGRACAPGPLGGAPRRAGGWCDTRIARRPCSRPGCGAACRWRAVKASNPNAEPLAQRPAAARRADRADLRLAGPAGPDRHVAAAALRAGPGPAPAARAARRRCARPAAGTASTAGRCWS